jgi:hypothetical protein
MHELHISETIDAFGANPKAYRCMTIDHNQMIGYSFGFFGASVHVFRRCEIRKELQNKNTSLLTGPPTHLQVHRNLQYLHLCLTPTHTPSLSRRSPKPAPTTSRSPMHSTLTPFKRNLHLQVQLHLQLQLHPHTLQSLREDI